MVTSIGNGFVHLSPVLAGVAAGAGSLSPSAVASASGGSFGGPMGIQTGVFASPEESIPRPSASAQGPSNSVKPKSPRTYLFGDIDSAERSMAYFTAPAAIFTLFVGVTNFQNLAEARDVTLGSQVFAAGLFIAVIHAILLSPLFFEILATFIPSERKPPA